MANCAYCDEYVVDDETAGMLTDGSFRLYHPECAEKYELKHDEHVRCWEGEVSHA